jgi:NAD(P)-dependent dehydrogenase (short-subunit alcohol dehydrogenase family)
MTWSLDGRVAVVTGGSRGIGQGVARRLSREGARIAILDLLDPAATRAELPDQADLWFRRTDLADPGEIEQAFVELERDWGPPSVLVNVAGVFTGLVPFLDTTPEQWDFEVNINARGLYFASQSAAKRMRRHDGGRIVNILSTAAVQGFAMASAYCASKGAALAITRVLAVELAGDGILVNAVGPGSISAPTSEEYLAETEIARHEMERTPLGRLGTPDDIAEAVAFFAGPATWVTGQAVYVDGGFMAAGLPYLDGLTRPQSPTSAG